MDNESCKSSVEDGVISWEREDSEVSNNTEEFNEAREWQNNQNDVSKTDILEEIKPNFIDSTESYFSLKKKNSDLPSNDEINKEEEEEEDDEDAETEKTESLLEMNESPIDIHIDSEVTMQINSDFPNNDKSEEKIEFEFNYERQVIENDLEKKDNIPVTIEFKNKTITPERKDEETTIEETFQSERKSRRNYFGIAGKLSDYMSRYLTSDQVKEHLQSAQHFKILSNDISFYNVQEPWPKGVKLYQPYEMEQILLPDNANCLAVQTFLKMCNLEYQVEYRANAEAMSPTGKVPFIKCGNFVIAELEGIVQFVGSKGISLTEHLDAESKADMRAYMTLVNNVLGNAELYICWCDNETYNEITKPRYSSVYPWPLNHLQTWSRRNEEIKKLTVIGWGDKSLEEVYDDVEHCCQTLTDRLDDGKFFFGDKPTELEALIFGHLYSIITTPLSNANLANIVKNFPKLIDLIKRIEKKYFERETSMEKDA